MKSLINVSSHTTTSQFVGTTHTSNNREEIKLKMLLTGSYDFIHRETGKMIQKKLFKKAFILLEKFHQSRKDLQLAEIIQLNRRILTCVTKILKDYLVKPEEHWKSEDHLMGLVNRGTDALNDLYKFMNIFIQKVLPSDSNKIVLKDVSQLSITDEQIPLTLMKMMNQFDESVLERVKTKKAQNLQSHLNQLENNEMEGDRIAEMIQRNEKFLNVQFELEQLWYNVVKLLILSALIYKRFLKTRLAYFSLIEADRLCKQLIDSNNPKLINLCGVVKIMLANILFECGQSDRALREIDYALLILTGEMKLLDGKSVIRSHTNKAQRIQRKCVKTTCQALLTSVMIYESAEQFQYMMEGLNAAVWLAEKFVIGLDELKKHIVKLNVMGKNRLDVYFHELSDLSHISHQALEQEIYNIKKSIRSKVPKTKETYHQDFNKQMHDLFKVKELNKQQYFITNKLEQINNGVVVYVQKQQNKQEINSIGTENSFNIADSGIIQQQYSKGLYYIILTQYNIINYIIIINNSFIKQYNYLLYNSIIIIYLIDSSQEETTFEPSFLSPSNFVFDQQSIENSVSKYSSRKQKLQSSTNLKSVGLLKIGHERQADHKSRILTTNNYFKPFEQTVLCPHKLPKASTKKQRDQDLDQYMGMVVQDRIGEEDFQPFHHMLPQLGAQLKQEQFDQKEFAFAHNMLNMKMNEAIRQSNQISYQPTIKIQVDAMVRNEAFTIEQRWGGEMDVRDMRKRKIEMVVAAKQMLKQEEVNFVGRDAEDANFWRSAIDKNKKKSLKELILLYAEQLGLKKFKAIYEKEKAELERVQNLKIGSVQNIQLVVVEKPIIPQPKSILKNGRPTPKQTSHTNFEEISSPVNQNSVDKCQKQAHQVISMIVDGVERKMQQESKELNRLLYLQKGGKESNYFNNEEITYLKFMGSTNDLGRSSHLLEIKRLQQQFYLLFIEFLV